MIPCTTSYLIFNDLTNIATTSLFHKYSLCVNKVSWLREKTVRMLRAVLFINGQSF